VPPNLEAACDKMSSVLSSEHDLLDGLAYRLEAQRLVLVSGDDRRLPRACRDLETARDEACTVDLLRAVRVEVLARALRLDKSPNLKTVAEAVSEPWREMYVCHGRALAELANQILQLAEHNRAALAAPRGDSSLLHIEHEDRCLVEIVYEVAVLSLDWLIAPALTDFLA
jgi:hypothetical protein